ncbi:unnamed protein product [Ilex paraguariensis]|uniref:Transformation/transcription domain-associated protein n=1 Tax=Ilex paraguariensis TaxID=185542 RepID=A0ABC8SJE5_9AQUA
MAMEVRDSLEITHTGEYLNFLKCYFRAFSAILYHITKPQFADNPEHKLRNIVVEILNRLPHSEVLRPFVQELLKVAMHALTTDNEENGLICIRIIFDLLRNFRPTLENEVQPFLDFVCRIYQNFRATVTYFFESGAVSAPVAVLGSMSSSTLSSSVGGEDVRPMELSDPICPSAGYVGQLNPSTRSFKIVTESPLVVMFLFQLYGRLVQINIPHLLPLMVAAISVPGPEKVPPHLKTHFIELKGAQVKPQFADNPEHKLRNIVVEILNRLPHSEVLRPFVQELLKVAMHALTTDNEENGLICIRIIFDLLRNFRPTLENEVQPFLDFVCRIYQNFRATVTYFFESGAVSAPVAVLGSMSSSTLSSSVGGEDVRPMELSDPICPSAGYVGQLNPSTRSFKIVTESPLVVMFLFQLYGRLVQINIPHLLPLMVAAISVPGPEKVPPHLKTHFIELKGAQVKQLLSVALVEQ